MKNFIISIIFVTISALLLQGAGCQSSEFSTAKMALQQKDLKKAEEFLLKELAKNVGIVANMVNIVILTNILIKIINQIETEGMKNMKNLNKKNMKNASSVSHTQLTLNIVMVGLLAVLFILVLDLSSRLKTQEVQATVIMSSMEAVGTALGEMDAAKK